MTLLLAKKTLPKVVHLSTQDKLKVSQELKHVAHEAKRAPQGRWKQQCFTGECLAVLLQKDQGQALGVKLIHPLVKGKT